MKYLWIIILLSWIPLTHAANAVGICPTAKTGDHAPECSVAVICAIPTLSTDMVRTIVAQAQVWEPYATLTAGSAVTPCPSGGWSSLTAQGIPTFANLVVPPPVVTPPPTAPPPTPPTSTQAVSVIAVDNPQAAALFPSVPNPECFTLSNGTQSVTACLPK
jgi:hypothetical protein